MKSGKHEFSLYSPLLLSINIFIMQYILPSQTLLIRNLKNWIDFSQTHINRKKNTYPGLFALDNLLKPFNSKQAKWAVLLVWCTVHEYLNIPSSFWRRTQTEPRANFWGVNVLSQQSDEGVAVSVHKFHTLVVNSTGEDVAGVLHNLLNLLLHMLEISCLPGDFI